ncbi:bifunctional oligoribonuclease/PAP phosphatase NrnA [Azotosporobacter soli]|uniref:DHH family phosphoesterase n=1 Tax=Azotosporobacter soli TaxID=3055040 RepID=UPI0031FED5AC
MGMDRLINIAACLQQCQVIAVTSHQQPDGDSLGSMLALYHQLAAMGKTVHMLLDDEVPAMYRFLPGWERIRRPLFTDRVDALVVLDAGEWHRIGIVAQCSYDTAINIDHHLGNTIAAKLSAIDTSAAATGELVYHLIQSLVPGDKSAEIAVCLYTAIVTDCGFFRYANTSPAVLRIAATLVEWGARPKEIAENVETRTAASLAVLGKVLDTLEIYADGKIAFISVDQSLAGKVESTEGFVNYPRAIEGVEIAALFKETEAGIIRVSLRSKNADVNAVARAFSGGGHHRAAGCTVKGSLADAKAKVLAQAAAQLKEYGV